MSLRWTLSLFLLLSFSRPIVNPLQPLTHPLETHYAELDPCWEVFGCTRWSASPVAFDQIWLIDEHPKQGCGAGPNIFSSDALALILTLSVFSFFPSPIWNVSTLTQTWAVFNMNPVEVSRMSWPSLNLLMSHPRIVILRLLPSRSLYLPLFVPLFGCTFICWVTDQVQWSVLRTCHELEQKPISAALQSHKLPIPPEVTVASEELCYWLQ